LSFNKERDPSWQEAIDAVRAARGTPKVIVEVCGGCVTQVEVRDKQQVYAFPVVIVDYDNMPPDTDEDTYYHDLVGAAEQPTKTELRLDRYVWRDADALVPKGVRIPGFVPEFRGYT
jgi:hypothetical protein